MDANLKGSSQQIKEDAINRRNGQGPQHLKSFLLLFLTLRPKPNKRLLRARDELQLIFLFVISLEYI